MSDSVPSLLSPRSALVTGAAGAVGASVCAVLAKADYRVLGLDRFDGERVSHTIDLEHDEGVAQAIQLLRTQAPTVLVLAHGILGQSFSTSMRVNLTASISILEEFAHIGTGAAVIVGSVAAHTGASDGYYSAAKGGLISYARSMARRRDLPISTVIISPGPLDSPMNNSKSEPTFYLSRSPISRLVSPLEVAHLIGALIPFADILNGGEIIVDGGIRFG